MIGWLVTLAFSYLEFVGLVFLLGLLIVVVVAVGLHVRECWLLWRATPVIEALDECWSIPSREPIRTKLP